MKPWVFTFRCVLLLLVLLVNVEAAKKGGIKKKGGVTKQSSSSSSSEVMVDIGVGPSMIFLPGTWSNYRSFYYGVNLDLYAVITPEVIKNNINKVPKKYRKQALRQKGEMQMGVGPMMLIPTTLIISPPTENVDLGIYGAIWDFFGLSFPLVDGEWGDFAFFAKLPTIQISLAHGSVLEQPEFMIAGGGSLGARLLFRITPTWHLEGKYVHNLYVPLDLGTVQFSNGLKQELTYAGVASVLIHHRIPYKYK